MRILRVLVVAVVGLLGTVWVTVSSALTPVIAMMAQLLSTTALIMGGTWMTVENPDHMAAMNEAYLGNLPANDLRWVQTPEQFWPATGISDMTFDKSVAEGVGNLDDDIHNTTGTKIVVGYSQSATIATKEKRDLALQSAAGQEVPLPDELSFVLVANPNRANGGILARFPGLYIPILDVTFDGATPEDQYQTIDVAREYDLISDFPEYPLNLLATANALAGYVYLHGHYGPDTVDLNAPGTISCCEGSTTTYYLIPTDKLPILQPLRDAGVPPVLVDSVEPVLRVLIDLGYDRTPENMGKPTPAKLFGPVDPVKLATDLSEAVKEGVQRARADLAPKPATTPEVTGSTTGNSKSEDRPEIKARPEAEPEPELKPKQRAQEPKQNPKPLRTKPRPTATTKLQKQVRDTVAGAVSPKRTHAPREHRPAERRGHAERSAA